TYMLWADVSAMGWTTNVGDVLAGSGDNTIYYDSNNNPASRAQRYSKSGKQTAASKVRQGDHPARRPAPPRGEPSAGTHVRYASTGNYRATSRNLQASLNTASVEPAGDL